MSMTEKVGFFAEDMVRKERVVAKFGGSSLADASQMRKVAEIIRKRDPLAVIVSAPGKRNPGDIKVTDLLLEYARNRKKALADSIRERIRSIEMDLGISDSASSCISESLNRMTDRDEIVSRGEYASALIMSELTGRKLVDPIDCISIGVDSLSVGHDTYCTVRKLMPDGGRYVIPGFYGKGSDGKIKTFTRGGSDTTGSVVARALDADVYENYTDVSGVYAANPKVIADAPVIRRITYAALRSLAEHGTEVFCLSAIEPVENRIRVRILNTNRLEDEGTEVICDSYATGDSSPCAVTSDIAGSYIVAQDGSVRFFPNGTLQSAFDMAFGQGKG